MSAGRIRVAFIGLGYRGEYLYRLVRCIPTYEVVGIADPELRESDYPEVACYSRGEEDYRRMLAEARPQLTIIASPWALHTEQTLACLEAGSHVGLEVRGGSELGVYDALLETSARLGLTVYPLENAVFMRECLAVWRMVEAGALGEIVSLAGGYRHDLRPLLVSPEGILGGTPGEGKWRTEYYTETNGDLYPTHGIAPLALMIGLGRRDAPHSLYSVASRAYGLAQYIEQRGGVAPEIATGDVVTTQIVTRRGVLVRLTHDTTLPRPRSLDYEVQGTRGIWQGEHRRIYMEGMEPDQTWQDDAGYVDEYEHPLWRCWGLEALEHDEHHRGMDYIMLRWLAQDVLSLGEPYPITLADMALWSAITPLSAESIRQGTPVPFAY